jgi:hypothetical protein
MKSITKVGVVFLFAVFAVAAGYGAEQTRGVAGVDVVVKQNPSKRAVTDARGNFAFDALAPGSYILSFRSRKAQDTKVTTTDKVAVATSFSIKIDGTKRSVNQSGLTNDKMMSGVDIRVEVGPGAKIRGQVAAGAVKRMVWIPKEPGSNIPGRWVEAGSGPHSASNAQTYTRDDMREMMSRGNANMTDPMDTRNAVPGPGR